MTDDTKTPKRHEDLTGMSYETLTSMTSWSLYGHDHSCPFCEKGGRYLKTGKYICSNSDCLAQWRVGYEIIEPPWLEAKGQEPECL